MVSALLTSLVLVGGLGLGFRTRRHGLIGEHRYANRYSDATAAREDDSTPAS
jgi:hypothetical protein